MAVSVAVAVAVSVAVAVAVAVLVSDLVTVSVLVGLGASGGSVDLIRPSGAGVRMRVDWFSGRVEQEPIER